MTPKSTRSTLLLVGTCLLLPALAFSWWAYYWSDRTVSGQAATPDALPYARELVASLSPHGPINYQFRAGPKDRVLAVSGVMGITPPPAAVKVLGIADAISKERARDTIRLFASDPRIRSEFADGKSLFWYAAEGEVTLFYRPADGTFTLLLYRTGPMIAPRATSSSASN
jgi:hypothetical protein